MIKGKRGSVASNLKLEEMKTCCSATGELEETETKECVHPSCDSQLLDHEHYSAGRPVFILLLSVFLNLPAELLLPFKRSDSQSASRFFLEVLDEVRLFQTSSFKFTPNS